MAGRGASWDAVHRSRQVDTSSAPQATLDSRGHLPDKSRTRGVLRPPDVLGSGQLLLAGPSAAKLGPTRGARPSLHQEILLAD